MERLSKASSDSSKASSKKSLRSNSEQSNPLQIGVEIESSSVQDDWLKVKADCAADGIDIEKIIKDKNEKRDKEIEALIKEDADKRNREASDSARKRKKERIEYLGGVPMNKPHPVHSVSKGAFEDYLNSDLNLLVQPPKLNVNTFRM